MKIYTNIPKSLKPYYLRELQQAKLFLEENNYLSSWKHLENAHVLGQPYPYEHTFVHWKMLLFGIRIKNYSEIIGQIPRLIFGGVKSFVGKIPVGNTGGSNVPPLKSMKINSDLQKIIQENQ